MPRLTPPEVRLLRAFEDAVARHEPNEEAIAQALERWDVESVLRIAMPDMTQLGQVAGEILLSSEDESLWPR